MTSEATCQWHLLLRSAAALLLAASVLPAGAAEWNGRASVTPAVTYTDNVCLTKSNKKDEWIGTLTPSGSIEGRGRKASLVVNGSVQLNTLTNSLLNTNGCDGNFRDREQFRPRVLARFNSVLIDNLMNLEVQARANQNEITARFPGGGDDLDRRGNTNTFYRYSISPVVNRRLKDWVILNVRYRWDQQFNSSELQRDSSRHTFNLTVRNASPSKWSRRVEGRYTQAQFGEDFNGITREDNVLSSARVVVGYRFNRRWEISGFTGREWNDFQSNLNGRRDGFEWGVDGRWTPSPRTSVSVGTGERFFGDTTRFDIRHQHRRSSFNFRFSQEVRFENDIRAEDLGGFEENINNLSVLSNGPILDQRFILGWTFTGRRSTLSVNGNFSQQTRSLDGEQSRFKNVTASFSPQLPTRFRLSGSVRWSQDEPRGRINELPEFEDNRDSFAWTYTLNATRQFNNRFNLTLSYQFTDRQSDSSFNEFQENRITASIGMSL